MIRSAAYRPAISSTQRHKLRPARRLTGFRRIAGRLALLATLFYTLVPFALPERAEARPLIEICTAHGIVTIPLPDGAESPLAPESPAPDMTDCPSCALAAHGGLHAKAAMPQIVGLAAPPYAGPVAQTPYRAERAIGRAVATRHSRGPPLIV